MLFSIEYIAMYISYHVDHEVLVVQYHLFIINLTNIYWALIYVRLTLAKEDEKNLDKISFL